MLSPKKFDTQQRSPQCSTTRRRGSLPLKKRNFQPFKTAGRFADQTLAAFIPPLDSPQAHPSSLYGMLEAPYGNALSPSSDNRSIPMTVTGKLQPGLENSCILIRPKACLPPTGCDFVSASSRSERSTDDEDDDDDEEGECFPVGTTPKRSRLQPMLTPRPGGCHGKSARSNSYCRRLPCYNGSNYCKLHYRQYNSNGGERTTEGQPQLVRPCTSTESGEISKTQPLVHQDRRFMGDSGDVQCQATTTRGRPCAYVAVGDTRYCNLHAEYDTNPPPRRGGVSTSQKNEGSSKSQSVEVDNRKKSPGRRYALKLKEKHADSPFPLLSMISTDQWGNKKVRIATGPFEGKSGEVKKWGNGWVSVQIPGVGLHNRRSFELYLHPEDDDNGSDSTSFAAAKGVEKSPSSVTGIFRCVSRDIHSPSPQSLVDGAVATVTVTPRPGVSTHAFKSKSHEVLSTPTCNETTSLKSVLVPTVTPSIPSRPMQPEPGRPLMDTLLLASSVLDGQSSSSRRAPPKKRHLSMNRRSRYDLHETPFSSFDQPKRARIEETSC